MSASPTMAFDPIGYVRCEVPDDAIARQRRTLRATVEVLPQYAAGLDGIEAYSHLIVVFWMHRATPSRELHCHPRGDQALEPVGVFAARGRNHPNPLGLAVVELLERRDIASKYASSTRSMAPRSSTSSPTTTTTWCTIRVCPSGSASARCRPGE